MDGLVCPRFNGIVKFTQKLMSKVHNKKDDNGKNLCPICGCGSPKGNLCQACFMRSFTPIAYSRNIKVVEQNEYFYGTGKNKRWIRKPNAMSVRSNRYAVDDQFGKGIMNYVVSATRRSFENSVGGLEMMKGDGPSPDDPSMFHGKTITELFQPAVNDAQVHASKEGDRSSEEDQSDFVQVELNEDNDEADLEPEDILGPLPKLVPDFWEPSSENESNQKLSERLKTLTNHVVKEAQRPFKEIFGEPKSDSGVTSFKGKSNHTTDGDHQNSANTSAESIKGFIKGVQKKLWKQTQTESIQTGLESHLKTSSDPGSHNCTMLNKQLKQKATLELLKVAFKTNMILNSLFYYFKKVAESEGSNSESLSENQDTEVFRADDLTTADCKISVDSFFFPTKRSAILWGSNSNCDKDAQSSEENLSDNDKTGTERSSVEDSRSEVEVLSKSQATLSMLMNRSHSWTRFGKDVEHDLQSGVEENYNLYMTGYDSVPKYLSRLLTGRIEQHGNLGDCTMGTGSRVSRFWTGGASAKGIVINRRLRVSFTLSTRR
uniref:Uncharacterized protein n=1 Tax=Lygus hesperus TaxID=30085 RepID=A0A0K8SQK2_LYGHE